MSEVGISISSDERNFVVSFIQFLENKLPQNVPTDSGIPKIVSAISYLEQAFNIDDGNYAFQPQKSLFDMFLEVESKKKSFDEADIKHADNLKEEGNKLVQINQFEAAIEKYNEAITLHKTPVYFCNRAAAYSRLEKHDHAARDARTAIALDPNYAKAYARFGMALSCQKKFKESIGAYKKAIELDPTNESYRNNLSVAEANLREEQSHPNFMQSPFANLFGGIAGEHPQQIPNLTDVVNLMQDGTLRSAMDQMMNSGLVNENFLQTGLQMAQQLQETNPGFLEEIIRSLEHGQNPDNGEPAPQ